MDDEFYVSFDGEVFDEGPFYSQAHAEGFAVACTNPGEEFFVGRRGVSTNNILNEADLVQCVVEEADDAVASGIPSDDIAVSLSDENMVELNDLIRNFLIEHNEMEEVFEVVDIERFVSPSVDYSEFD